MGKSAVFTLKINDCYWQNVSRSENVICYQLLVISVVALGCSICEAKIYHTDNQ